MPYDVRNPDSLAFVKPLLEANYRYSYPDGMNLKPGSELHDALVKEVLGRARESFSRMSERREAWRKIDEVLTSYIPIDEEEQLVKQKDRRKPVSIVVPVTQASLEIILTHFVLSFLNDPIFKYEAVSPEDVIGSALLEKVIDKHCRRNKVSLALYTMFRDSLAYGLGVVSPTWVVESGGTARRVPSSIMSESGSFISYGYETLSEEVSFEGNALENVNVYSFLPDWNVPAHQIQNSEYVGWVCRMNRMMLLEMEADGVLDMFNCKYISHIDGRSSVSPYVDRGSSSYTKPVDVIMMYMNIIPKELGLGKEDRPTKWMFAVAGDRVLIVAKPLGLAHNKYPIVVCSPDYDGYSTSPISRLERTYGMQTVIDFMINSHVANVRKVINDRIVVDPSLVNMNDLVDSKAGGIIRLRRSAWGRGVQDAVQQLRIADITSNHVGDAFAMMEIFKSVIAATDVLHGIYRRGGERVSAQEARDVKLSAISRLETLAKVASVMAMLDIGYMFAEHTKQLMTEPAYVKLVGRWEDELRSVFGSDAVMVRPEQIDVPFDVVPCEGVSRGGEFADVWVNLFSMLINSPVVNQFDVTRIFRHIANLLGAKGVGEFIVRPNEEVIAQKEAGNLVPLKESSAYVPESEGNVEGLSGLAGFAGLG